MKKLITKVKEIKIKELPDNCRQLLVHIALCYIRKYALRHAKKEIAIPADALIEIYADSTVNPKAEFKLQFRLSAAPPPCNDPNCEVHSKSEYTAISALKTANKNLKEIDRVLEGIAEHILQQHDTSTKH